MIAYAWEFGTPNIEQTALSVMLGWIDDSPVRVGCSIQTVNLAAAQPFVSAKRRLIFVLGGLTWACI